MFLVFVYTHDLFRVLDWRLCVLTLAGEEPSVPLLTVPPAVAVIASRLLYVAGLDVPIFALLSQNIVLSTSLLILEIFVASQKYFRPFTGIVLHVE